MNKATHCKRGHEFTVANTIFRKDGRRRCRECVRADSLRRKRERESNQTEDERKAFNRRANLAFFYNMTPEEYDSKLEEQELKCANPSCPNMYTESQKLHVDHDHSCCPDFKGRKRKSCGKCVRGLLCPTCNLLLGLARDDAGYLMGLVEYLSKWKE